MSIDVYKHWVTQIKNSPLNLWDKDVGDRAIKALNSRRRLWHFFVMQYGPIDDPLQTIADLPFDVRQRFQTISRNMHKLYDSFFAETCMLILLCFLFIL